MKINRFVGLAIIVVLVVATMSLISVQVFAQTPSPAASNQDCDVEDDDASHLDDVEDDDASDADHGDEECGDQDEAEDEAEGADVPISGSALDTASAVALEHTGGGRVTETEVGDEEGYYEVEVTHDDGRQVDVHLDENFNVLSEVVDSD